MLLGLFEQLRAPGFLKSVLQNVGGVPLSEALRMLPDPERAASVINEALAKHAEESK